MKSQTFSVDASLLEELGERLIGRAPIALAELVKNAYDADAPVCSITLHDDAIIIADNGHGMSESAFLDYWMRIGTTNKVDRVTSPAGRALTGSKGIGRLSVQFLADEMVLESTADAQSGKTLFAVVDWSVVKRGQDLDTVTVLWEMRDSGPQYPEDSPTGTRIILRRLKSEWDYEALESLGSEVWRLRSPFKYKASASEEWRPEEFEIEIDAPAIEDAHDAFDKMQRNLFASWKARIRGTLERGRIGAEATVEVEFAEGYPSNANDAEIYREAVTLPIGTKNGAQSLVHEANFEILIFKTEGVQKGRVPVGDVRAYLAEFGNVSLYDAGFRLPYYGSGRDASGQDWLSIALDQGRRINTSELLPEHLRTQNKYMQDLPAPGRIFGAVEINTNRERAASVTGGDPADFLQIQPGRDRLHNNDAFRQLRDLVRYSLDFYANRHRLRALNALEGSRAREAPSRKYDRVLQLLEQNRKEIPANIYKEIRREAADARKAAATEEETYDSRAALLAPLATAGMTAIALSHELAREIRVLGRAITRLTRLAAVHGLPELAKLAKSFEETRQRLASLQEIFAPLAPVDAESAVDRLRVRVVVQQVTRAMRVLMPNVAIDISGIPTDLRFPVGTIAEWSALLQNLLANAWNATLDVSNGTIAFSGGKDTRGGEWLRLSDNGTGLGVPLEESNHLFEPFERALNVSSDKKSIAIGGQGLGLAIVRMIALRRDARVAFVRKEPGFSTTFELSWRGGAK